MFYRVFNTTVFGEKSNHQVGDSVNNVFTTPNRLQVAEMLAWADCAQFENDGGISDAKIAVIDSSNFRTPLKSEKSNHYDSTDKDEVLVVNGIVVDMIPADVFRKEYRKYKLENLFHNIW